MRISQLIVSNLCYHCIYNHVDKMDHSLEKSTCSKFGGRYSDMCRLDENKCGKEGKFFKEKESSRNLK